MAKIPFREYHLFTLLRDYDLQNLPLDLFISNYFREHKALGPKDRAWLAEIIYSMIRWKGLLDFLCDKPITWEKRFLLYQKRPMELMQTREDIPLHVRLSFPKYLFDRIVTTHGIEKARRLCLDSNAPAPTTVRANTLKISRSELLKRWSGLYDVVPCIHAENGIVFRRKINFFSLPEFKEGFFEVQDEGSQLLAARIRAQPGQHIMDYCAGSGGKTLAFAPAMQNSGQIYLHDIRNHALEESRKRLRRAGIQNAQIIFAEDPKLQKLKKKMDWVLVDAPCSGTGTMRRNPDMKWNFDEDALKRLVGQQRTIFERALSFMRPEGRIAFGTCSILKEENEEQLEHFLKTYNLEVEGEIFKSLPTAGAMDGFFCVVFKNRN